MSDRRPAGSPSAGETLAARIGANLPRLSPLGEQDIAAMNARTYDMTPKDRERWFAEHPVADFEDLPEHAAERGTAHE